MQVTKTEEKQDSDIEQIADDMMEVEMATKGSKTVEAEITEVQETSKSNIRLTVELPSGETRTKTFDRPETWSDEFEFVRLLRGMGYDGAASVTHLPGSTCEVLIEDEDEWTFGELRTWKDKIGYAIQSTRMGLVFLGGLLTSYLVAVFLSVPAGYTGSIFQSQFLFDGFASMLVSIVLIVSFVLGVMGAAIVLSPTK